MHVLVACPKCSRQFDAGHLGSGDHFHCLCGRALEVPETVAHDAAVVRCSSCGAPRRARSRACDFCSADFTLREQELHTLCPQCMTRISDRARYCHNCGIPILAQDAAGKSTELRCPACANEQKLRSRRLHRPADSSASESEVASVPISVLECSCCAGLWLSRETFEVLRARVRRAAPRDSGPLGSSPRPPGGRRSRKREQPIYRPCPKCGELMHRTNYGRKSGVLVDSCRQHGIWFDASELDAILDWVQSGGESTLRRLERQEEAEKRRRDRFERVLTPPDPDWARWGGGGAWSLGDVLGSLFEL